MTPADRDRILAETDVRRVPAEYAREWMALHPERIVDTLWMLGDDTRRAAIERLARLPDAPDRSDGVERRIADDWDAAQQARGTRRG